MNALDLLDLKDTIMMVLEASAEAPTAERQRAALARAAVLALVYLADSIQAAARVAQAQEEER